MDDDQRQVCDASVWDPAPADPAPAPIDPVPQDAPLEWCHQRADLPLLGTMGVEHWWLKHGDVEGGLRGDGNSVLGTETTNHAGESANAGATCEPVADLHPEYAYADPACVDAQIKPGRPTGTFSPWNNCHTEAEAILEKCTPQEKFESSAGASSGAGAGPSSGEGGAGPY